MGARPWSPAAWWERPPPCPGTPPTWQAGPEEREAHPVSPCDQHSQSRGGWPVTCPYLPNGHRPPSEKLPLPTPQAGDRGLRARLTGRLLQRGSQARGLGGAQTQPGSSPGPRKGKVGAGGRAFGRSVLQLPGLLRGAWRAAGKEAVARTPAEEHGKAQVEARRARPPGRDPTT